MIENGIKIKINTLIKITAYLLLFLVCARFINKNSTWCIVLFIIEILGYSWYQKKLIILKSKEFILLILFSGSYFYFYNLYNPGADISAFIALCAGAPMFYFIGYTLFDFSDNKENTYWEIYEICTIGTFFFAAISYITGGVILDLINDKRYVIDFWTGAWYYCTNFNAYCILSCIGLYPMIKYMNSIKYKILWGFMAVYSCIISLATGSRTNLYIVLIISLLGVIINFCFICQHIKISRVITKKKIKKAILIIVLLFLAFLLKDQIIDKLPLDVMIDRFSGRNNSLVEDSRWKMWADTIDAIRLQPFGNIKSVQFTHNIYLDVARVSGIIPMIFLMIFNVLNFKYLIACFKNYYISNGIKCLSILISVGLFLSFMIEPVFQAKPYIFILYCMFMGMNRSLLKNNDLNKN